MITEKPRHKKIPRSKLNFYTAGLNREWRLNGSTKMSRIFVFNNFSEAFGFAKRVAALAEKQQHHPEICVSYNRVSLELTTHTAKGLTEKDFLLAQKIDALRIK